MIEPASAEEALRLITDGANVDLLVTDHLMPGTTGVELAPQVRSVSPELPIQIVSGYAELDGVAPDLARLTKPFSNVDLAARLAALLPPAKQG